MNTSSTQSQSEIILFLLNRMIETFSKKNLKSLNDLANEKILKTVILEIEPKIESNGKKFELADDQSFGVRYGNILSIISVVEKYKSSSPDKSRFTSNINFKNSIIINDLLKHDKEQLTLMAEMLFFLCSISSRKDYYLDKISEIDDLQIANTFFNIIEKYMIIEKNDDTINQSPLERSYVLSFQMNKLKDEYEKQIKSIIRENESKINFLSNKNEQLEKGIVEAEMKLKDKERELEIIKVSQAENLKYQEQLFKDSLTNSLLINQLNQKDAEISDLKSELAKAKKRYEQEIVEIKDKNEILEEKLKEMKMLQMKNQKGNSNTKESSTIYNKSTRGDKAKDFFEKEYNNMQSQIEKLMKEIVSEKERYFRSEEEKKKLERNINDLKKELQSKNALNINNISAVPNMGENNEIIVNDSFFNEIRGKQSEKENESIRIYKSQIDELTREKEKLTKDAKDCKNEVDRLKQEVEKKEMDKEKAILQYKRLELDIQKMKMELEKSANEKKETEREALEFVAKNKKEIEQLKAEINSHKTLNEKILSDKKSLLSDYKSLQKEFEKFRSDNNGGNNYGHSKVTRGKNTKMNNVKDYQSNKSTTTDAEIFQLKNEIQTLKLQNLEKDNMIKTLKAENEEKDKDKAEDLDFYKQSYEEQKQRVNEEHKLISDSLYQLAVHFMSLKDDLQRKINNNK